MNLPTRNIIRATTCLRDSSPNSCNTEALLINNMSYEVMRKTSTAHPKPSNQRHLFTTWLMNHMHIEACAHSSSAWRQTNHWTPALRLLRSSQLFKSTHLLVLTISNNLSIHIVDHPKHTSPHSKHKKPTWKLSVALLVNNMPCGVMRKASTALLIPNLQINATHSCNTWNRSYMLRSQIHRATLASHLFLLHAFWPLCIATFEHNVALAPHYSNSRQHNAPLHACRLHFLFNRENYTQLFLTQSDNEQQLHHAAFAHSFTPR